ncbi:MAG: hypothetical protein LM550_12495 [Candidatus Contendobacter sp.]|nr:hypothetical protein [Candidatus Contendobacter sp.]
MSTNFLNSSTFSSSLTVQITEAERRLQNRHRLVRIRGAMLGRTLQQRMTDPVLLLWAGGLGFLMGEFTQRQIPKLPRLDHSPDAGRSFFETVLDLIKMATSICNLLAAHSQEIPSDKANENQQEN